MVKTSAISHRPVPIGKVSHGLVDGVVSACDNQNIGVSRQTIRIARIIDAEQVTEKPLALRAATRSSPE